MSDIKVLGPQFGLNELLDALTQEMLDERAKEPMKYNPLRPSSAGKCERELGYEYAEFRGLARYEKKPNSPDVHRLLNLGNSIETHLIWEMRDAFKCLKNPIEIKYQQQSLSLFKLHDGQLIEGKLDLVLVSDKFKMICDVKSKGVKHSSWAKSSWEELAEKLSGMKTAHKFGNDSYWVEDLGAFIAELNDALFASNFFQLNLYACSDFIRERGIDCASIIQYNKSTSELREIRFKPCMAMFNYVREKFQRVAEVVDTTKDPKNLAKEFAHGTSKCGFCPYNKECYPEEDALKAYFKTLPPKRWPKDLDRLSQAEQNKLKELFNEYEQLAKSSARMEKVEQDIIVVLDKAKVTKLRLEDGKIFEVRRLKSGGPGGGPRSVLRRGKL